MNLYLLGAFILSMLCGLGLTPAILDYCKKKNLYDIPNERKVHKNAIPRLGGVCFMPSMLLVSLLVILVHNVQFFGQQIEISSWSIAFFFCLLIIYTVGIIDDIIGLGAKTKFSAQIVASVILVGSGLYIDNFYGFMGIREIPFYIGAPLTIFVMVFISNAINLIDGIDGLSGSLSLIALSGFLYCVAGKGMTAYSILIASLMGVLVTFLYFNIFGKAEQNRKIFMGDSGSLTLGFILGFLFVKVTMYRSQAVSFNLQSIMIAYSLLIVPVYDVVRVSMIRFFNHTPIFQADKNHIHHKLLKAGMNQHQALLTILALDVAFLLLNCCLWQWCDLWLIVIADIAVWIGFHLCLNRFVTVQDEKR